MNLVQIIKNEPITTTLIVAEGMEIKHRAIMELVDKNIDDLEEMGTFTFETQKSKGRPTRFAYLNECQAAYLITLMRNSKIVKKFKKELTKEFFRQRKLIAQLLTQRKNEEWLEARKRGIVARKEETDVIKAFVKYATDQGSTHAEKYYKHITNAENKALFFLQQKFKNVREMLVGHQLSIIANADKIAARAIEYGMKEQMSYKDIYKLAKQRLEEFADLIGKTKVPLEQDLLKEPNSSTFSFTHK